MKKRFLFILLLVFLFPVFTNAEEVKLTCDKLEVKKDEEINCQIVASGVEYVTTSVVGQITIDDNMELISSEYDEENWKILDQEFSVRSINLMSENLELKDNYVIVNIIMLCPELFSLFAAEWIGFTATDVSEKMGPISLSPTVAIFSVKNV